VEALVSETDDPAAAPPPRPGVWGRAFTVATSDQISLTSAGCAFYAMLALFPALSLAISLYGLVFDPVTIERSTSPMTRRRSVASWSSTPPPSC
jgi:hypothetical protein